MPNEKNDKHKVSIIQCNSYNPEKVRKALSDSLKNINFEFKKGAEVLIKPNVLAPHKPEQEVTTHPVVLEELCKILKKYNSKIYIGESSSHSTDKAFEVTGVNKLGKYAKIINFESEPNKFFNFGEGMEKIPLPKIVFDVDLIIDFAKLKTHGFTGVTLCTKNLYGCVPGIRKSHYHKIFLGPKKFSRFLNKIEERIKPRLCFVDGIIGLEGEGPGAAGKPFKSKILIAGTNAGAVDIVASEIMGFKPMKIYTNKFHNIKRKEIVVVGNGKKLRYKFKKPYLYSFGILLWVIRFLPQPKIISEFEKCQRCGICIKKCPVKALTLKPNAVCNHELCIKCLCCVEVCPHDAIHLKESLVKRVLSSVWNSFRKI